MEWRFGDKDLHPLKAITPIDGRYRKRVEEAERYFSEYALIHARLRVEVKFLERFVKNVEKSLEESLPEDWCEKLREIVREFDLGEAEKVKGIEERVGHDVKALINYLRVRLREKGLKSLSSLIHIGLTSNDVNNIAYSTLLRDFLREVYLPELVKLLKKLVEIAQTHLDTAMLGRTHGQPATPTTFGKFTANYAYRIAEILEKIAGFKFPGKIGGAVGDNSALKIVYPNIDWESFSREFVEELGLEFYPASTQILPHDRLSTLLSTIAILNSVLSNLCRDLWMLGALGLLRFVRRVGEAHSSTMPHKSNPIYLENAEGALDLASSILSYMAGRLLSSRLHRDLSDSVIKRFYGVGFTLSLLGLRSLLEGLMRIWVDVEAMRREVEAHRETLAEAVQLILRRYGVEEGYEIVQKSIEEGWEKLLETLEGVDVPEEALRMIQELRPESYAAEASKSAKALVEDVIRILERLKTG